MFPAIIGTILGAVFGYSARERKANAAEKRWNQALVDEVQRRKRLEVELLKMQQALRLALGPQTSIMKGLRGRRYFSFEG